MLRTERGSIFETHLRKQTEFTNKLFELTEREESTKPLRVCKKEIPPQTAWIIDQLYSNLDNDEPVYLSSRKHPEEDEPYFHTLVVGWQPLVLGDISCVHLGLNYLPHIPLDRHVTGMLVCHSLNGKEINISTPVTRANPNYQRGADFTNLWIRPEHKHLRLYTLNELAKFMTKKYDENKNLTVV